MKYKTKYQIGKLLGPLQKKKCPYCLNNFRLFEVKTYHGSKECPRCKSPLTSDFLSLPTMVLVLSSKEFGSVFQKRCFTSGFATALLHKEEYILTPLSEKRALFLVSKKSREQSKHLCMLRCFSLTEEDLAEFSRFKKSINGLILFMDAAKEEASSSVPTSIRIFLQNVLCAGVDKKRFKRTFPLAVVISSLKGITEYLPWGIASYTKNISPEFKGDVKLFSGYIRSLLGFWYGMPFIHTLEQSSYSIFYSALNLEESHSSLSYEVDILSYFLAAWGFKERNNFFKSFFLREKSFRVSFKFFSFAKKKKKEKPFKEKREPSLKLEE